MQLTGPEALADLSIDPEFVALTPNTRGIAGLVRSQKEGPQSFGDRAFRDFGKRLLGEFPLTGEDALHPA
jgi:hypothetical protein